MQRHMNDNLRRSRATRRTVVTTGAKLAYAAPVVAVSLKISRRSAAAAQGPNGEFDCDCLEEFSYHPDVRTGKCVSCNENVTTCPGGSQPEVSASGGWVCRGRGAGGRILDCAPSIVDACKYMT